jgi:hypothetical protein
MEDQMGVYWEYKIIPLDSDQYFKEKMLNELGKDRWELTSVVASLAYLKSPINPYLSSISEETNPNSR